MPTDDSAPHLAYFDRLRHLDRRGALALAEDYLARTGDVERLYSDVLQPALVLTGREWEADRLSVAHEHYITEVTRDVIRHVSDGHASDPFPGGTPRRPVAVACGGPGERHVLGLMMVADLLRRAGVTVHLLGEGAPASTVRDFLVETDADWLCLSCALPIHLPEAADLIALARQARPDLTVLVGGAAFADDPSLATRIDADHAAPTLADLRTLLAALVPG